jgi:hypothetical protein
LHVILVKIIIMAGGYHFSTGEWAVLGVFGRPVWALWRLAGGMSRLANRGG